MTRRILKAERCSIEVDEYGLPRLLKVTVAGTTLKVVPKGYDRFFPGRKGQSVEAETCNVHVDPCGAVRALEVGFAGEKPCEVKPHPGATCRAASLALAD